MGAISSLHGAIFELQTATIADVQTAMDAGALTSERLVQLYLNRIEAYDKQGPKINAIISLNPKALDEARALDAERKSKAPRSQLHGVPVLLKDLIDVAGLPTTAGFIPFGAPVPPRDSTVAARLRAAGAVILGKASTYNWFGKGFDETHPIGPTLNPYNIDHVTGGTSNGPAAAIAANFATVAIGTDTSASVLYPSACCGITGMLGTQGMVSRAGIVPHGATMDRAGPMARSVYDAAVMFSAIAGWDAEDLITFRAMGHFPQGDWARELEADDLPGRRLGVLREMMYEGPAHEEGRAIFDQAIADLRKAGAVVVDPVLTGIDLKKRSLADENRTATHEQTAFVNAYLARLGPVAKFKTIQEMVAIVGREKFSSGTYSAFTLPPPEKSPVYLARYRTRDMFIKLFQDVMDRFALDALVLPYRTIPPERVGTPHPPEATNQLTSHFGAPAVVVPAGYARGNLPIGLLFFGRQNDDLRVLKIAHAYEEVSRRRRPPTLTPPLAGERFEYEPKTTAVKDHVPAGTRGSR